MAAVDVAEPQVVQKGEGPFDLFVRLGAVMGAATALLTSVQGILDALRSQEIAALLPLIIGLMIVLGLFAAIAAICWFAQRSRSAAVSFIATLALAAVTTVLGMALAASALPHFGYQLALQRVSPVNQEFAEAPLVPLETPAAGGGGAAKSEEKGASDPFVANDRAGLEASAQQSPSQQSPAPSGAGAGREAAADAPAADAPAADAFAQCAAEAQADTSAAQSLEEALLKCLTP